MGWNIHKEPFMQGATHWLDELKLRAGYGVTSNQAVSPYSTLGSLSTKVYNFNEEKYATGYYVSTLPNTELGWEYSNTWNFGLDYSFFKGRLRGTVEYYRVDTKDILLSLSLPASAGVSRTTANIGATRNRGIEFTVNGTILEKGDWKWDAGLNIYANRNKLVALADGTLEDKGNRWFVGYPLQCIYDYEYDGLWQEGDPYMDILEPSKVDAVTGYKGSLGMIKVKYHGDYNADGSPTRAINSNDQVPYSAEATFMGGFNTRLAWKDLDLTIIGDFQVGGIFMSSLHTGYDNLMSGRRGQIDVDLVGPSLGSASIKAGMISFIIAFLLILVYMIIFYRKAGIAADIALLCNVLFLFGALASFGTVFTLSGIAGLVLTMGMAVDANVIIYERIKEELNAGKALRLAISDGYKNAYSAILDGQITTILTGIILYIFGSGTIKGFAAVLVIGIVTSVLTSIFITRLIFEAQLKRNKDITFYSSWSKNFLKNTHIDFLGKRKVTYLISGALCLLCLAFIFTKGFSYGVDFSGGRTYTVRFDQPVTPEQVRAALLDEFGESSEVKQFGGASQMRITTKYLVNDKSSETDRLIEGKLFNALKGFYANELTAEGFTSTLENPNGIVSSDRVDASIASEMKRDAVIAVIIALIVIFGYIAFRFKNWTWGIGGVSSLIHNSIIMIGFYSIFSGVLPFTLDVDQTFIAAVLTIIGYSINDNVVIFDRIREYRTLFPKRPLEQNINEALNSTLSRTINTSVSTLLVLIAIAIFGGESIRGFSVSLAVGVIIGTYASIFIGTPIMYDLNRRKLAKAEKAAK